MIFLIIYFLSYFIFSYFPHNYVILPVPSAPQNLSTKTLNATAIRVSWKEPKKLNGKIKYRLSCERTGEPSSVAKLLYDGNNTQFIVSDLKPYTRYIFSVTAYNVKYNLSSSEVFTEETTDQAGKC